MTLHNEDTVTVTMTSLGDNCSKVLRYPDLPGPGRVVDTAHDEVPPVCM